MYDRSHEIAEADGLVSPRVELHCHLLPGADDGPATMEESVALARALVADGTRVAVVTPHIADVSVDELPERMAELEDALARRRVELTLHRGGELPCDAAAALSDDELEAIAVGPPGASWILLEPPFQGDADEIHEAAATLRARGYGVVVAHPERAAGLTVEDAIQVELDRGSRLLVNAGSLLGDHGTAVRAIAVRLVAERAVHALASDAHSLVRPPCLSRVHEWVAARFDPGLAQHLTAEAPRRLLERGVRASTGVCRTDSEGTSCRDHDRRGDQRRGRRAPPAGDAAAHPADDVRRAGRERLDGPLRP